MTREQLLAYTLEVIAGLGMVTLWLILLRYGPKRRRR